MVDDHRAVLFGGCFFFDSTPILFVLDLNLMASNLIPLGHKTKNNWSAVQLEVMRQHTEGVLN